MHQPKNFLTLIFLLLIEATSHGAEIPNDLDGRSVGKVIVPQKLTVKELPIDGQPLPLLAIARPDGVCYSYDPNNFRLGSIWQGPLGWLSDDGLLKLNQSSAKSFHFRDKPWMCGVGKGSYKFDYKWLGYRVEEARVVMEFELKGRPQGRIWRIE